MLVDDLSRLARSTRRQCAARWDEKERGFFVGESAFGYRSVSVGEMRIDKKGWPRPDGYRMEIEPKEAGVVLRIYQAYADGQAMTKIVRELNEEGAPGRVRSSKGWSPATVSRILDNPKYAGRWIWNKTGTRRDPKTGRRRSYVKPESEWIISEMSSFGSSRRRCGTRSRSGGRR